MQPMSDALEVSDGFRDRLATVAAEYGKFKLEPDLPGPSRESYSKFTDPVDELFNRLATDGTAHQAPRGSDHPEDDERSARSLGLHRPASRLRGHRHRDGTAGRRHSPAWS